MCHRGTLIRRYTKEKKKPHTKEKKIHAQKGAAWKTALQIYITPTGRSTSAAAPF